MAEENSNGVKVMAVAAASLLNGTASSSSLTSVPHVELERNGKQSPPLASEDSGRYLEQNGSSKVNIYDTGEGDCCNSKHHNNETWDNDEEVGLGEKLYPITPQSSVRRRERKPPQRSETVPISSGEPEQEQQQQSRRSRGRRRVTVAFSSSMHRSTSTPNFECSSDTELANSFTSTSSSKKGNNNSNNNDNTFQWQREDFGRPLMSERRSLSPKGVPSWKRHGSSRPAPSRLDRQDSLWRSIGVGITDEHHDDEYDRIYNYDIPGMGLDTSAREGIGRVSSLTSTKKHRGRRASMPEHLDQALRKGSCPSEVMDPNAMRYLPKILRDTYAQRQTRRKSDVSLTCY